MASLSIGDFSRATQLSIKTLRKYHESGLLEPAWVDPNSGYRRYSVEQISTAQLIRRFRSLEMPLVEIRSVLSTSDLKARNELISTHLLRLESNLAKTHSAVTSLRNLIRPSGETNKIEHRNIPATAAACIVDEVDVRDALAWFRGAIGELNATFKARRLGLTGSTGGMFSNALFSEGRGQATIFFPTEAKIVPTGRVKPTMIQAAAVAVIRHAGSHDNVDLAYGALAKYVAEHTLAVIEPIREYYVVGPQHTDVEEEWLTEIAWPIFEVRSDDGAA
ncbi:MerR family transcriptional regulator [Silvibacterium acidisoli]|uniref:MerR family transcriptional regulator n=1 Tax=Acidobacteriaceae bacterium ZG23-2 TaxID=2883246 RepID=UPI00406D40E6